MRASTLTQRLQTDIQRAGCFSDSSWSPAGIVHLSDTGESHQPQVLVVFELSLRQTLKREEYRLAENSTRTNGGSLSLLKNWYQGRDNTKKTGDMHRIINLYDNLFGRDSVCIDM